MIYPQQGPVGYRELADMLRAQITSEQLRPGQRLPSEGRLAQEYGVATKTARAALRQLRDEGLAESVRGRGVVVRAPVEPELVRPEQGSVVWARNPTPEERRVYDVPEGVPLLIVTAPDGIQDLYPAPVPGFDHYARLMLVASRFGGPAELAHGAKLIFPTRCRQSTPADVSVTPGDRPGPVAPPADTDSGAHSAEGSGRQRELDGRPAIIRSGDLPG